MPMLMTYAMPLLRRSARGLQYCGGEAIPLNWLVNEIARANRRWRVVVAARGMAVFTGLRLLNIFAYSLTLNTKTEFQ